MVTDNWASNLGKSVWRSCLRTSAKVAVFLIAISLIVSGCRSTVMIPLIFDAGQQIGRSDGDAKASFLRVGPDGQLYAIWTEKETDLAAAPEVTPTMDMAPASLRVAFMSSSADGGRTWSCPVRVNDKMEVVSGDEDFPKIAVARDGRIYAVWSIPNEEGNKMKANVRFTFGGVPWGFTPAQTLNDVKNVARFPSLEISPDGTVFVSWIDRRVDNPAPRRVYLTRISLTGTVLSSNQNIGGPACECCRLTMAFADGGKTVYLAYREKTEQNIRDIVIQKSTDGGVTFGQQIRISDDGWYSEVCPHSGPVIATDASGNLHVVWWTPGRTPEDVGIYYTISKDGGLTFAPRKLIHAANSPEVLHPVLALDKRGNIYMAWDNFPSSENQTTQIFFCYLTADGTTLSLVQQLSQTSGNALRPSLTVSNDKVHVAWIETKGEISWVVLKTAPIPK